MDCNKKELEELFGNHGKGNGNHGSLRSSRKISRKGLARNKPCRLHKTNTRKKNKDRAVIRPVLVYMPGRKFFPTGGTC